VDLLGVYCPHCEDFVLYSKSGKCTVCGQPYSYGPVPVDSEWVKGVGKYEHKSHNDGSPVHSRGAVVEGQGACRVECPKG